MVSRQLHRQYSILFPNEYRIATRNELGKVDENFSNISVFHDIGQFLMQDIRDLREMITPSKTDSGDGKLPRKSGRKIFV